MQYLNEQEFVSQHSRLELSMLWNMQPVEADKGIGDMVTKSKMVYLPSRCIQHRLKAALQIGRETSQHCITVIQPGMHQRLYQSLERGHRHWASIWRSWLSDAKYQDLYAAGIN